MADHPRRTSPAATPSPEPRDPLAIVWRQAENLAQVVSDDGDRYAILPLDADGPIVLTGTAAAIWSSIDGRSTTTEVIDGIRRRYDVAEGTAHAETLAFLSNLREQRLVEPVPLESTG